MSFDTLAPYYRRMEQLFAANLMQLSRTAHIEHTQGCRNALLAGEGPGQFLVALLETNAQIRVTCVEGSAGMIQQAQAQLDRRHLRNGRVNFVQQDALEWSPPRSCAEFDLVVTDYFLDCFSSVQLAGLIRRLAEVAAGNATWLLADFRVPLAGWRRWRARFILGCLYAFFRATTQLAASRLTPPDEYLRAAGFQLAQRREWSFGLVHSDLWRRARA